MKGLFTRLKIFVVKMAVLLIWCCGPQNTMNLAHAQYFTGPVSSSLGGAGVAASHSSEVVFLNPAVMPVMRNLEASLYYQDGYVANHNHRTHYGLTLSDNSENVLIAGAISYLKGSRTFTGGMGADEQYWNIALGQPLSRKLFVGVNIIYLDSRVTGVDSYEQWDGSVGFLYLVNKQFSVGGAYQQMASPDSDVPLAIRLVPTARLGLSYSPIDFLNTVLDISRGEKWNPEREGAIHWGVETIANEFSILRFGGKFDDYTKRNYFTFGWGFNGPRLKMNYSFEKPMKDSNGALHSVDFRVGF